MALTTKIRGASSGQSQIVANSIASGDVDPTIVTSAGGNTIAGGSNTIVATNAAGEALAVRFNAANVPIVLGIANSNGFGYFGWNTKAVVGSDTPTYDVTAGGARLFADGTGAVIIQTAPSGAAGSSMSLAEVMRVTSSQCVGIGTITPTAKLDLAGNMRSTAWVPPTSGVGVEFGWYGPGGFGTLLAYDRNSSTYQPMRFDGTPLSLNASSMTSVGVWTTAPACALDVNGTVRATGISTPTGGTGVEFGWYGPGGFGFMTAYDRTAAAAKNLLLQNILFFNGAASQIYPNTDNTYPFGSASNRWTAIYAVTGTIQTSDRRQKTDIEPTRYATDFLRGLVPVDFRWARNSQRGHGLVAQDVAAVAPDFAGLEHDEDGVATGLNYSAFIAPLVRGFQELDQRVSSLELGRTR